ncbi:hypothetical protein OTU49_002535, partial [Cherax quadricarinatus]
MCKKENADEEQALNQENELLHQLILEVRKTCTANKNSLYHKERDLENLNSEFDATKARVERQFLTKVCTSSLAYLQLEESEVEQFKNSVDKMSEKLLKSIASIDKDKKTRKKGLVLFSNISHFIFTLCLCICR